MDLMGGEDSFIVLRDDDNENSQLESIYLWQDTKLSLIWNFHYNSISCNPSKIIWQGMSAIRFGCRQLIINIFQEKMVPNNLYLPVSAGKKTIIVENALIVPPGTEYSISSFRHQVSGKIY